VTGEVHGHLAGIQYLTINADKLLTPKVKPQYSNRGEGHNNDEESRNAANQETKWPQKNFTLSKL
jgi:hypothetical protein